jgi:hypothetical protein
MSILDNEGHSPTGMGNAPSRKELAELRHENRLLRQALDQVRVTCEGNAGPSCDKGMALAFVGDVARHALERL